MATLFIDIDGTILKHLGNAINQVARKPKVLSYVYKRLEEWDRAGHKIIMTTGRRESCRAITERQLESLGIFHDQLVMGVGNGPRYIINDRKVNSKGNTAFAINIDRNEGLKNVRI